jgi:hypothetical protein
VDTTQSWSALRDGDDSGPGGPASPLHPFLVPVPGLPTPPAIGKRHADVGPLRGQRAADGEGGFFSPPPSPGPFPPLPASFPLPTPLRLCPGRRGSLTPLGATLGATFFLPAGNTSVCGDRSRELGCLLGHRTQKGVVFLNSEAKGRGERGAWEGGVKKHSLPTSIVPRRGRHRRAFCRWRGVGLGWRNDVGPPGP